MMRMATIALLFFILIATAFSCWAQEELNFTNLPSTEIAPGALTPGLGLLHPVDPAVYRLGPGDKIAIHVIVGDNALTLDYDFVINPDGTIFFQHLGEIPLNGFTLNEAKEKIAQLVKRKYTQRISVSLLLVEPRWIKVYMVGQVARPGLYSVTAVSRLSELLDISGGVLPGGSKREVAITREGKVMIVDLYRTLQEGRIEDDVVLAPGDIVSIPLAKNRVTVVGEVNRSATYEIKPGERLSDLVRMAGGLSNRSALSKVIFLKRQTGTDQFTNSRLNIHDVLMNPESNQNVVLQAGDMITIPAIESYVYVHGNIGKPGRYEFVPGKKLSDYLNTAGGVLANADIGNVTIARSIPGQTETKMIQVNAFNILRLGMADQDVELSGGDVIQVPGNFFYMTDFASFSNIILTGVALYNVIKR